LTSQIIREAALKIVNFDLLERGGKRGSLMAGKRPKNDLLGAKKDYTRKVNFDTINNNQKTRVCHFGVVILVKNRCLF
jgi:hypothetical protein